MRLAGHLLLSRHRNPWACRCRLCLEFIDASTLETVIQFPNRQGDPRARYVPEYVLETLTEVGLD